MTSQEVNRQSGSPLTPIVAGSLASIRQFLWLLLGITITVSKVHAETKSCATGLTAKSSPEELQASGKRCMVAEDWAAAVGIYTKLSKQTNPVYKREALEMLGLARERNGQKFRAKTAYEEYLKTYPQGEGTERVKQRLDGLLNAEASPREKLLAPSPVPIPTTFETFGSWGQYYFRDAFINTDQGEYVDQSLFLTTLDVTSRMRSERFDMRAQFDARYRYNFLDVVYNENDQLRVANMFIDVVDKFTGVSGRLGRQSRSSGGVMGRFDGGLLSYRFNPEWQVTAVGGFPVIPYCSTAPDTSISFAGASVEYGPFLKNWAGNFFFINQNVSGNLGRRAIGGEVRYLDPVHPVFTLLDYDVYFNALNTAQVVGNWNFSEGTTVTLTADYRKSPYLSVSNALIGWGSGYGPGTISSANSINQILFYQPNIDLKSVATDNTPTFKMLTISGITPIMPKLQVSADITISNLSATEGSIWVTPYQGSGTQVSFSTMFIAQGLVGKQDVWNIGARYMTQQIDDIFSIFVDGRYVVNPDLRLDPRLRVDYFTGFNGPDVWRVRPGLRLNYQVISKLFAEIEAGVEYSTLPIFVNQNDAKGYYFSVGYRYDI